MRAVTHQGRMRKNPRVVRHQIRMTGGKMRRRLAKGHEEAAYMSGNGTEMRWVRVEEVSALGEAPWRSPGPEATTTRRIWKETLGWDDGFEPVDTEMRASGLA